MYIPVWLLVVLLLGVPIVGTMYRYAKYPDDYPAGPHPVLGWLGVIAIFAGAFAVVAVIWHALGFPL